MEEKEVSQLQQYLCLGPKLSCETVRHLSLFVCLFNSKYAGTVWHLLGKTSSKWVELRPRRPEVHMIQKKLQHLLESPFLCEEKILKY